MKTYITCTLGQKGYTPLTYPIVVLISEEDVGVTIAPPDMVEGYPC